MSSSVGIRESFFRNVVPCDHSLVGCDKCREERAARAQEKAAKSVTIESKGTQAALLQMLEAAQRENRDLSAAVGRLGAENKNLREQLQQLRTESRKKRRKS